MKRAALMVVLSVPVLLTFSSCCTAKGGTREDPPTSTGKKEIVARTRAGAAGCPFDPTRDSKSQSSFLRGSCLEPVDFIEQVDAGPGLPARWQVHQFSPEGGTVSEPITLREAGFDELNPIQPSQPLYEVLYEGPDGIVNLCEGARYVATEAETAELTKQGTAAKLEDLKGKAILVPGYWKDGRWREKTPDGRKVFTPSCLSGAVAKCVHWGYVPGVGRGSEPDLGRLHRACVQAARAQYVGCGNRSYTCPQTAVDIYDSLNIRRKGTGGAGAVFESLWSETGLVCMARSRWPGCSKLLTDSGVIADAACKDPVPGAQGDWPTDGSAGAALIAISSPPGEDGGGCPGDSKREVCPASP